MNRLFVVGAVLLALAGCDNQTTSTATAGVKSQPTTVPQENGQYLRFTQMPDGETRLEAHRISGGEHKMISGYPGFSAEPGKFPEVSPMVVRVKDCGLLTFTKANDTPGSMSAARTDTSGFNDQCPIQKLDGLWFKLAVNN
ncbi:hypothetical protein [Pseudomonas umsongensis]